LLWLSGGPGEDSEWSPADSGLGGDRHDAPRLHVLDSRTQVRSDFSEEGALSVHEADFSIRFHEISSRAGIQVDSSDNDFAVPRILGNQEHLPGYRDVIGEPSAIFFEVELVCFSVISGQAPLPILPRAEDANGFAEREQPVIGGPLA